MNTRYVIPIAAAVALHGALFFGIPRSVQAARTKPNDKPDCLPPIEMTREIEVTLAAVDESTSKRGEDVVPPSRPEPPDVTVTFDQIPMERPPVITGPVIDGHKILPFGKPDGDPRANFTKDDVLRGIDLDKTPRTRYQVAPIYPFEEKKNGVSGEVWIEFDVDVTGVVHNARVTKSSHRAFEEPTLRAVAKWRFEPGKRHGEVVPFRMTVPVIFSLNE